MRDGEIAALGGPTADGIPAIGGQWDFDGGVTSGFPEGLTSTIGSDMQYFSFDAAFGALYESVPFGSGTALALHFSGTTASDGYRMIPGGVPNAGGLKINRYTLLMDVMYPSASQDLLRALWQTRTNNNDDASLFINPIDGIGISSEYAGNILPDTWYRLGFTFDLTTSTLKKYTNGVLAGQQTLGEGIDGRWAVSSSALLFADNDGDLAEGFCNSVQFRPLVLSADEMRRLGPPTAGGLPVPIPTELRITRIERIGFNVNIAWGGGQGPYQVQTRSSLSSGDWTDFGGPTAGNSATLPMGGNGFIRVVGQ
jgi:hypothetical protein